MHARTFPSWWRTLLAFVISSALLFAAAQGRPFSAEKDLEGFESASLTEFHELYALDEYKAYDGKTLSAPELEAVRQRWAAERARVAPRIAAIKADPRERWIWQFERKLAKHGYFSKIAWTLERPAPGFVFVVQRPAKDDPGYAARITGFYQPFVARLSEQFESRIATPAALVRRAEQPVTACAVLASKGDLDNFARFVQDPTGYVAGTTYDYQLQLAVSYEDPFATDTPPHAKRSALLYQVAKELQHAWLGVPGNRPGSIWLYEGLALYLAMHTGTEPAALDAHALRASSSKWLVDLLPRAAVRDAVLLPADQLAELRSWDAYAQSVAARAKTLGLPEPENDELGAAYFAQCDLWVHYLFDGGQGLYRKPFLAFVQAAFRGRGGAEDLQRAFAGTDLAALSRDALRWVCADFERTHPGQKADRAPIDALFAGAGAAPASGAAADPASASPAAETKSPTALAAESFAPRLLAPAADDAEAQLALALAQAREGDLEGATSALRALAEIAHDAPWPERSARECARLAELVKLRDGYLATLQSGGGKLAFKHKGKDVLAPVLGVENGLVKLGENKLGLPSIPLASVDPYEIAKVAAKKEQQGSAQPWARFYAYLLAGDARWEKLLKDDAPGAKELREDGKSCPALLKTAQLARELYELSRLPLPRDEKEAGARLERVKSLLAAHAGSGLLERRIDALRQFASLCLLEQQRAKGAAALLHGQWTDLGEGRGRLVYEFDAAEEMADWLRVPNYMGAVRSKMPPIGIAERDSKFELVRGTLRGVGSVFYRCAPAFVAPLSVRYKFRYEEINKAYVSPRFNFLVCDDGHDSYIACNPSGDIRVADVKSNDLRNKTPEDRPTFDFDKYWDIEIRHDGQTVATRFEGQDRLDLPVGKRLSGHPGFFIHSELPVIFDRIEIEGRLDPQSLAELQRQRVDQQLRLLGFP